MNDDVSRSTKKFFRPQMVSKENSLAHAGQVFTRSWDREVAKGEIIRAKLADDIPRFELNKVELHISARCNLKCGFCYGKEVVPEHVKRVGLSRADVLRVLEDIRNNMPDSDPLIVLAGLYSEPVLHNDVIAILDDLGSKTFRFGVYTNGLCLDERKIAAIADNAQKNRQSNSPSYISFNVTATLDEHNLGTTEDKDTLRRKQLATIRELSQYKSNKNSPIIINASILALPHRSDYCQIVDDLDKAGVDNIRLSFPWSAQKNPMSRVFGGLTKDEFEERKNEFSELRNQYGGKVSIRLPSGRLRYCFVMAQSLAISSEGDIFPCPEVCSAEFRKTHSYGSIHADRPISQIWGKRQHHARFLELDPDDVGCVCCHVDRELNEELTRYWEDADLYASSVEESPYGEFEWQWAGENWYGKVVLREDSRRNTVATARVGRLTKEYDKDVNFHFKMGEVILDSVEGSFEIIDKNRLKIRLTVRKRDENGDMNDECVEGVLKRTQCFAGEVEYSDSKRDAHRYGGMVLVKRESIVDEAVRNWFLSPGDNGDAPAPSRS